MWKAPVDRGPSDLLHTLELPLYVHAPYLINVATTKDDVRERSQASLAATCAAAARVGALGVVVHGGHLPVGVDPAVGVANWRATLEALETDVPVLIENTAGGKNPMARNVAQIERLWAGLDGVHTPYGFCLDTCHLHSGVDDDVVESSRAIRTVVGTVDLLHVNDSHDDAGSGRDHHANLGDGNIDPDALLTVIAETDAPVIVETPGGADAQRADLTWMRERLPDAHGG